MADIQLGPGNNTYTQSSDRSGWDNIYGEAGNDRIGRYNAAVLGGAGNDTLESLAAEPWVYTTAAYWDSPAGVEVNLVEGWANDGWGGRDTLINIRSVNGSWYDDRFTGSSRDEFFSSRGGRDTIDGGGGFDQVHLEWITPGPGEGGRPALLAELNIEASVDGRLVTISPKFIGNWSGGNWHYTLQNVEAIELPGWHVRSQVIPVVDLISPQTLARDGLLAADAQRWNAGSPLGSAVNLSYSFVQQAPASGPGATGFRAFTPLEQAMVREVLASVSRIAQVNFTEVTANNGNDGQLRFGVSQQAGTKGLSWLPNQAGAGDNAGDVWMDAESMQGLAPGREGFQALLHEIGHALGLRHPRNVDAGEAWATQLLPQHDSTALSVMSQQPSPDGLFRAEWGPLDVLALRLLYGTRASGLGDTLYSVGPDWGRAQFTLVDDGGIDTLDASTSPLAVRVNLGGNQAAASLGLSPGGLGANTNLVFAGTAAIEVLIGSAFDDHLVGDGLANTIIGGAGNDWIDGGDGIDTVVIEGPRNGWRIAAEGDLVTVVPAAGGTLEMLRGIERVQFNDAVVTLTQVPGAVPIAADLDVRGTEELAIDGRLPDAVNRARNEITYTLALAPLKGTVTVDASGNFRYTPAADAFGADWFDYRVGMDRGGNVHRVFVQLQGVNDAPRGSVRLEGAARVGESLTLVNEVSDPDGLGPFTITWLRDGEAIAGASGSRYTLVAADAGKPIAARVSWTDGGGTAERVSSAPMAPGSSVLNGSTGDDTLAGGSGSDLLRGLDGNDLVFASAGADTLDGGEGALDVVSFAGGGAVQASLRNGSAQQDGASDQLAGFEAIAGSAFADTLTGSDRPANPNQQDEFFKGGGGNDTIDGGTGIDRAEFSGPRSAYTITRTPGDPMRIVVSHLGGTGSEGTDTLVNVERLLFNDRYIAFGPRAEELARVALALWNPGIAPQTALFTIGYSYYDIGYTYEQMIGAALLYWGHLNDLQLAQHLKNSVPGSSFSVASLQLAMEVAGGGAAGRVAAVRMAAEDPGNYENVRLAGLIDNGVAADVSTGAFAVVAGLGLPGGGG